MLITPKDTLSPPPDPRNPGPFSSSFRPAYRRSAGLYPRLTSSPRSPGVCCRLALNPARAVIHGCRGVCALLLDSPAGEAGAVSTLLTVMEIVWRRVASTSRYQPSLAPARRRLMTWPRKKLSYRDHTVTPQTGVARREHPAGEGGPEKLG